MQENKNNKRIIQFEYIVFRLIQYVWKGLTNP